MALSMMGGAPIVSVLSDYHANPNQENHINIAYRYWQNKLPSDGWKAILLVWENDMSVYTVTDFIRTFHR